MRRVNEGGPAERRWLVSAALGLVTLALAAAGMAKLGDPARFAADIGHYRLVSPLVAAGLALYLPWLEVMLAAGLWVPAWRRAAGWVATMLLAVFSAALVAALMRGIDLSCGCYGAALESPAGWALARNVLLLGLLGAARRAGRH